MASLKGCLTAANWGGRFPDPEMERMPSPTDVKRSETTHGLDSEKETDYNCSKETIKISNG